MDDALADRFARELADAIAAAVADDPRVATCRERARAAGYELRVTLDAVVGLVRDQVAPAPAPIATTRVTAPTPDNERRWSCAMTGADRRFLRSLRIAADQAQEEKR
jgi:hypothetical protein